MFVTQILTVCFLLFTSQLVIISCGETSSNTFPNIIWNSLFTFSHNEEVPKTTQTKPADDNTICVGCASNLYEDIEWEKEITALRIEYIKNLILKKLRLKEKPSITLPVDGLPKLVTENENFFPKSDEYDDDYYGKTTQAIVFPHEDTVKCMRKKRNPTACLPFQLPADLHPADVSMAELWVYKKSDNLDSHNQTFLVSEVGHWDSQLSFQKTKPIAMKETHVQEGWVKINVAWAVKNWLEYSERTRVLNVACKTCGMDNNNSPISFDQPNKPFLVIYTYSQPRRRLQRRIKRSTICDKDVKECCKESLYISFAEIGWDDWILHPPGYNAYFCKGSCTAAASVTISGSHHSTILQKYMYQRNLKLVPCCAPTQYQDLELHFMKDNKTLTTTVLPSMIVDKCGCM